ncbi:rhodanese-like domain-containing protein [Priestia aryabhattai]|uniref:Rhodanese-like domain-containing protein n=1 Tax=Priestia aryabhattai TaxID=412384 RepID=A0ABD7X125_PRIAR|nr:rhodanese-like domain-containing protein [Priestia aryabhattai]WEA46144.1 rhodanese-like domain-containing protein [Priestia aryabhattai]
MDSSTLINVLMIALVLWFLVRRFVPAKGIKQITTMELKSELKKKEKQFVDVRTPHEYRTKHIKGFKNIPLSELSKQANQLSKEKEVLVICRSGMRSMKASKMLKKQGFTSVTNIKGGMSTWR